MNIQTKISASVAATALFILPFAFTASRASTDERQILFAVWAPQRGKQPEAPILDPIATFDGAGVSALAEEDRKGPEPTDAQLDRFNRKYYTREKKYPLLFGGSRLGTASVLEVVGLGCVSLSATAETSMTVPNHQYSLATTSLNAIHLHDNWRQKPTHQQESDFSKAAAEALQKKGVGNVAPSSIRVQNLRATKLGEARPIALIGSIATYKTGGVGHNLFLVIEQESGGWKTLIASYHKVTDLEDNTDDVQENFVDQVDLASSDTDVIITIRGYYESWDYAVYRFENGIWKVVFEGGGGGC